MKKVRTAQGVLLASILLLTGALALTKEALREAASRPPLPARPPVEPAPAAPADSIAGIDPPAVRAHDVLEAAPPTPEELPLPPLEHIDEETLWLARCIYSETKRPHEQEVVAWVVRNRVESGYRGKRTYREVVLDPYQFSAFNRDSLNAEAYRFYATLAPDAKVPGWRRAISIAYHVRHADTVHRPFSIRTRHFYSERSMVERVQPEWAKGQEPVRPNRPYQIEARRFRFFEGIV